VAPDVRTVGLAPGDRIVAVDGGSPLDLVRRVRQSSAPVRYDVERAGRRWRVAIPPRTFT
jgi:hypothetical protein